MSDPSLCSESLHRFRTNVTLWFSGLEDIKFADKDGKTDGTLEGLALALNEVVGSSALSNGKLFFGRRFCSIN